MKISHFLILITNLMVIGATTAQDQNILFNINDKISKAQSESFETDVDLLAPIIASLEELEENGSNHWKEYWIAYAKFQQSMYWAYNPESVDEEKAKVITQEAITILENIDKKNVEDYALLGYVKGYSLQWTSFLKIPKESGKAGKWVAKSVELDAENPRANMVFGNNDYHTPPMFGGGKKAEKYLLNAISLFEEEVKNPFMPSWGLPNAYQMLVQTYIKKDMLEKAAETVKKGLEIFPDNSTLRELEKKILDQ